MIKSDFHIHSKYSPDSLLSIDSLIRRCIGKGLGLIAITDHNAIQGALEAREISPFPVIVGEEVTTADGELTGLFLKELVPRGLTSQETVKIIKAQGGLVSVPHPFDTFRRNVISESALSEIIMDVDIIEGFNARNTLNSANNKAKTLALEHSKPITSVTDSHTSYELGRCYTELPIDLSNDITPHALLESLGNAHLHENKVTPMIHIATTLTKLIK